MIKNNTALHAVCLALCLAQGCGHKNSNNSGAANSSVVRNGNAADNSGASLLSTTSSTQTPDSNPKTIQVRLAVVETNADLIDSPLPNSKVIVRAGNASLNKQSDNEGVVVFDSVPCGGDVVITMHDEENNVDTILNRKLGCQETQVDLGVMVRPFGSKFILEQRKPQFIEYDPIKNEWRSGGQVVPNEKIKSILGKYM